jgi:glycosyltransferase involved in cell wall biosynthesis
VLTELPSITIVTPCFNAAAFIERALDSVATQEYPQIEHVIVDAGSTDGTVEILQSRSDIRWISEPDEGQSDAMNKAVAMATGDIVGWLNADDWYLPGAFAAIAGAAIANPEAEWFTGRCPIVDNDGTEIRKAVTHYKNALLRAYSFPLYLTQNFISCPATFVRRDAYAAVKPFRIDYRYSMDYDIFLQLARRGDPVVLHQDLSVFTMTPNTKSMTGFEEQFREHHQQASEHGSDHPLAVKVNHAASSAITLTYRVMRNRRLQRVERRS